MAIEATSIVVREGGGLGRSIDDLEPWLMPYPTRRLRKHATDEPACAYDKPRGYDPAQEQNADGKLDLLRWSPERREQLGGFIRRPEKEA